MNFPEKDIRFYIDLALKEDIGEGDHTSLCCVPQEARGRAVLVAKEGGIVAGVKIAGMVFQQVDPELKFKVLIEDGTPIRVGDRIFEVEGKSISILTGERVSLNYIQRMSGIATQTHRLCRMVRESGSKTQLLDTRKTTPNQRIFEKMAVKIGGGGNHRFGLFDRILIKDNHIDFAGGIPQVLEKIHDYLNAIHKKLPIEIEVRDFEELREVLRLGGVDRIMLDNFTPGQIEKALEEINGRFETEASGGISAANLLEYAATNVDFISMGALTHHVASLDLSLKAE